MRLDRNGEKHRDQCSSTSFLPPPNPPIPRMGKDSICEMVSLSIRGIRGRKKEGGEALIPMLLSIKVETHRAPV